MVQELVYTSAPRGLKVGSKGFCTVASSNGMAANLADFLESLSGYRHLFPSGTAEASRNPVVYSYVRAQIGGRTISIVSRIADAGLDYSGRTNKLAHHLALEPRECGGAGPAWLTQHPGLLSSQWEGEPRILPDRSLPQGQVTGRVCSTWASLMGDAGWAGKLAQAILDRKSLFVIVDLDAPVLELVAEAIALLPPESRWEATFSTYFTKLPPGVDCRWKFVYSNTDEAAQARKNAGLNLVDTTKRTPLNEDSPYIEFARTGKIPKSVAKAVVGTTAQDGYDDYAPMSVSSPRVVRNQQAPTQQPLATVYAPVSMEERNALPQATGRQLPWWVPAAGGFGVCLLLALIAFPFLTGRFGDKPVEKVAETDEAAKERIQKELMKNLPPPVIPIEPEDVEVPANATATEGNAKSNNENTAATANPNPEGNAETQPNSGNVEPVPDNAEKNEKVEPPPPPKLDPFEMLKVMPVGKLVGLPKSPAKKSLFSEDYSLGTLKLPKGQEKKLALSLVQAPAGDGVVLDLQKISGSMEWEASISVLLGKFYLKESELEVPQGANFKLHDICFEWSENMSELEETFFNANYDLLSASLLNVKFEDVEYNLPLFSMQVYPAWQVSNKKDETSRQIPAFAGWSYKLKIPEGKLPENVEILQFKNEELILSFKNKDLPRALVGHGFQVKFFVKNLSPKELKIDLDAIDLVDRPGKLKWDNKDAQAYIDLVLKRLRGEKHNCDSQFEQIKNSEGGNPQEKQKQMERLGKESAELGEEIKRIESESTRWTQLLQEVSEAFSETKIPLAVVRVQGKDKEYPFAIFE